MTSQPDTGSSCSKWLKINVLGAVPVIGHFFTKDARAEAVEHAGRETVALAASTLVMLLHVMEDQEATLPLFLLLAAKMAGGMFIGRTVYNGGFALFRPQNEESDSNTLPLMAEQAQS